MHELDHSARMEGLDPDVFQVLWLQPNQPGNHDGPLVGQQLNILKKPDKSIPMESADMSYLGELEVVEEHGDGAT